MNEYPDVPPQHTDEGGEVDDAGEAWRSNQQIAHDRGRICKKRGCPVCAPLRARREEKRKQRKAEARAALHDKNKPCGVASCEIEVCVRARADVADATVASAPPRETIDAAPKDPATERRRQDAKHRLGLPCGSENCVVQLCVDGFANERIRRHRKGRPCRSTTCDTPICVAARSAR